MEIKVFGIVIMNDFRSLLKCNLDNRFKKLVQALISWSSRSLDTLSQRVEVVKLIAIFRIYYLASILPLTKTFISKVNRVIVKFLWSSSGRILRVSLDELRLAPEKGGLGLNCMTSMGKSIFDAYTAIASAKKRR